MGRENESSVGFEATNLSDLCQSLLEATTQKMPRQAEREVIFSCTLQSFESEAVEDI